jgi:type I restriction enzyme S subunit
MPTIDQGVVGAAPILVPPLPEEHEIVRRVDAIEARVAAATARAANLTQSILANAFGGELFPPRPISRAAKAATELAPALLGRIRVDRDASQRNERHRGNASV